MFSETQVTLSHKTYKHTSSLQAQSVDMRSRALAADADRLEELDASGCFLGELGLKFTHSLFMFAVHPAITEAMVLTPSEFQQKSANKAVRDPNPLWPSFEGTHLLMCPPGILI